MKPIVHDPGKCLTHIYRRMLRSYLVVRVRFDHLLQLRGDMPKAPEGHDGFETDVYQMNPAADESLPMELKALGRVFSLGLAHKLMDQAEAELANPAPAPEAPAPEQKTELAAQTETLLETKP